MAPTGRAEELLPGLRPVLGKPGVLVELPPVGPREGTQAGPVIVLWSRVTAACDRRRPFNVAPVCMLRLVPESRLPIKVLLDPSMLPADTILHQTLHGSPPVTVELADVVSVAADLKIHTPAPLRVRLPVNKKASAQ
jgi:hypothetical protein